MGPKGAKREKKRGRKARRAQERAQGGAALAVAANTAVDPVTEVDIDLTELASPIAEPPPFEPATRMQSGFAPRMPDPPRVDDETLSDHLVSLEPLYVESDARRERAAELDVVDPSLRLDGPYLGSPLTSLPPARRRSLRAWVALVAGVVFLGLSSAYGVFAAIRDLRGSRASEVGTREPSVPRQVRPEPAELPPPRAVEAPAPAAPAVPPAASTPTSTPTNTATNTGTAASTVAPSPARKLRPAAAITAPNTPEMPAAGPAAELAAASAPAAPAARATAEAQPTEATAAPIGPLPKRPSPSDVRTSFRALQDTMRACAGGRGGIVTIRAVVAGSSGRLTSGSVEGDFQSAEERACMTRAILALRLPPFEQSVFEVAYPLAL